MTMYKSVELTKEQIDLVIETLTQRYSDLTDLLKNTEDFEAETIQSMQLEQRDLTDIIRELKHYAALTEKEI